MFWRGTHGRISEPLGLKHFSLITKKKKKKIEYCWQCLNVKETSKLQMELHSLPKCGFQLDETVTVKQ